MRLIDPFERPEQQRPRVERVISARPPAGSPRTVLKPVALDTRQGAGGVYETIMCSTPECSSLAVATTDPESRVCEEHA